MTIGVDSSFPSHDPAMVAGGSGGGFILYYPYATLINKSPEDGTYSPGLAESFGYVGQGNKAYELKLRAGLKFANGEKLDAQAVKAWLTYFPTAGGAFAGLLDIASVETPDELTVRLALGSPTPLVTEALSNAWGMVVAPSALADPKAVSAGAPGAGPYVFDKTNSVEGSGGSYTYVPNKYYYDQSQIKWDKIVVKVIEDPAARLRAMQSGQLDVAMGNITTLDAAKSAGLKVTSATAGWSSVEIIDAGGQKVAALGDVRVRQALNYAIDRASIVKSLYGDSVEPTSTIVTADGFDPSLQDRYPYDPTKAKQLLAEAGYPDGFAFTMVTTTSGVLAGTVLTQALAQSWADIGVTVHVVSSPTLPDFFGKFLTQSAFEIDFPTIGSLNLAVSRYVTPARLNPYDVVDEELDRLVKEASIAPEDGLESLYRQMTARMTEQAYSVPIAANTNILFSTGKVAGVKAVQRMTQTPVVWAWGPS